MTLELPEQRWAQVSIRYYETELPHYRGTAAEATLRSTHASNVMHVTPPAIALPLSRRDVFCKGLHHRSLISQSAALLSLSALLS
jgi:hypothetical protein